MLDMAHSDDNDDVDNDNDFVCDYNNVYNNKNISLDALQAV